MKNSFFVFFILGLLLLATCQCSNKKEQPSVGLYRDYTHIAKISNPKHLIERMTHYDSLHDAKGKLLARIQYGKILRNHSDFEAAIRQHDTCIVEAQRMKDTLQLIVALNNQATNYRRMGDLNEAGALHYAALALCEETKKDTSYEARKNRVCTYNGLGNLLLSLENFSVAEDFFRQALGGETQLNSLVGQAINLANIGSVKESMGETDSAHIYYLRSLEKNLQAQNMIGVSLCHQHIGRLEYHNGNTQTALKHYKKSLHTGQETTDIYHWLVPCEALIDFFLEQHQTDSAERYIDIALIAARKIKSKTHLEKVYHQKAQWEEMMGRFDEALKSIRKSHAYKDSIAIEENMIHIQNLRVKYEIDKRNEMIAHAESEAQYEKKLRRIIMWSGIVTVLLVLTIIIYQIIVTKERKKRHKILKRVNVELQNFYRGITHQLRTPLTVITGMTEQLCQYIPTDNEMAQQEYDAVVRRTKDLLQLVNEMVAFNEGTRRAPEVSELNVSSPSSMNPDKRAEVVQKDANKAASHYVLIAEDEEDVALLLSKIVRNEGYECVWACNGEEAYKQLCLQIPLLLITDIMMPHMNGLELIKKIRENEETSHLPIMVVSARAERKDRMAGMEAGAEIYLEKPFSTEELTLCIHKILEHREILKRKYSKEIEEADKNSHELFAENLNSHDLETINKIDDFIHSHIMDSNLNPNELARHMNLTITTLNRKVKGYSGHTTTNYIRIKRLERARYLLTNSDMTMGEIQAICGFESPSYFSRAFKSEYGSSPSEYRKSE